MNQFEVNNQTALFIEITDLNQFQYPSLIEIDFEEASGGQIISWLLMLSDCWNIMDSDLVDAYPKKNRAMIRKYFELLPLLSLKELLNAAVLVNERNWNTLQSYIDYIEPKLVDRFVRNWNNADEERIFGATNEVKTLAAPSERLSLLDNLRYKADQIFNGSADEHDHAGLIDELSKLGLTFDPRETANPAIAANVNLLYNGIEDAQIQSALEIEETIHNRAGKLSQELKQDIIAANQCILGAIDLSCDSVRTTHENPFQFIDNVISTLFNRLTTKLVGTAELCYVEAYHLTTAHLNSGKGGVFNG